MLQRACHASCMTTTKQAVQPFRVTVTRNGQRWAFDVRGTRDMMERLCERVDSGRGRWGEHFGPLTVYRYGHGYEVPTGSAPTQYDDRDAADYRGAEPQAVPAPTAARCVTQDHGRAHCPTCNAETDHLVSVIEHPDKRLMAQMICMAGTSHQARYFNLATS